MIGLRSLAYRALVSVDRSDSEQVRTLQRELGVDDDGVYGRRTEAAHLVALDRAWASVCSAHGWDYTGSAVPLTRARPRGGRLLSTVTRWVCHWPVRPYSAHALDRRWARRVVEGDGVVCSHLSVDERDVIWSAGPHRVTSHAGPANAESIGVDICVPILAEDEAEARRRGIYVGHATGRRLALDPVVAERVGDVYRRVEEVLGVRLGRTDHAAVEPTRKTDCVVWRPVLRLFGVWGDG